MAEEIQFDTLFKKYIDKKDKFDSLYIFVIYKQYIEESIETVLKVINNLESMPDIKRKIYLQKRLQNYKEWLKLKYKPESQIDGIFMISDNIEKENLTPYYLETLNIFSHNKISYNYGCEFPIEWLKKLLLDREYINVLKIKNNDITHTKLNSTKKINIYSNTIKSMDLQKIVLQQIPKGENYLIHGSSIFIKNYIDKNAVSVSSKELSDDEIINLMYNYKYVKHHNELKDILNNLFDPKIENKLVYGKDIKISIQNNILKTLFCTDNIYSKLSKIPEHLKIFEIKLTKQIEKGDISEKLEKDYEGAIGIKFY